MKPEFEFIKEIRRRFPAPEGVRGIGDDCAVLPQQDGMETLVSTDMLVEGTHFLRSDITPFQLGWKAAASNFSDIAAMGGSPAGCFLALALPKDLPCGWEEEFLRGLGEISAIYGFPLLGGDTTSSPDRISVCMTVLGKAPAGRSLKRSTAVPGDLICVTGTLGDSAAGLHSILHGADRVPQLIGRHYLPRPRIKEGLALASCTGVHAMMDISDGIGSDLRHILEESGRGAEVELSRIPMSEELLEFCARLSLDPYDFSVSGGEDYELLFTVDPGAETSLGVSHTVIGRVVPGSGIVWRGSDRDFRGYTHF